MSRDVLNPQRPTGTDADLVIREARRRQRRRRLVTGLVPGNSPVSLPGTSAFRSFACTENEIYRF